MEGSREGWAVPGDYASTALLCTALHGSALLCTFLMAALKYGGYRTAGAPISIQDNKTELEGGEGAEAGAEGSCK